MAHYLFMFDRFTTLWYDGARDFSTLSRRVLKGEGGKQHSGQSLANFQDIHILGLELGLGL